MKTEKTIQYDQLPESAQHELLDFYEFLVQKYATVRKRTHVRQDARKAFFIKVKTHSFTLPADYSFNRDEIHER